MPSEVSLDKQIDTPRVYREEQLPKSLPWETVQAFLQAIDRTTPSGIRDYAIFLLIAGTYTPFTLGPLRGVWGWTILGLIWALAIFGIIMKATRGTSRHPKLGLSLYLGMGWLPLIVIGPLALAIPTSALFWLVAGGIAYTTGVLFFLSDRLRYAHLVWHLFVLVGTSCHFLAPLGCTS